MPIATELAFGELDREKAVLYAANYRRGYRAAELITWIERFGYAEAAGRASLTHLQEAAAFTRPRAPQHWRCIESLLAIRAVEHVEDGDQATQVQSAYLARIYGQLGEDDRQWCRRQLCLPGEEMNRDHSNG